MPTVELEPCRKTHRPTLEALFQLYTHDFSEQWAGTERGELQDDGRFEPCPWLDSYWTEPAREAFLIRADGALAGFVMLNDHSHAGLPLDHAVAEFFVVRKHRRSGVGNAAARAAIRTRPGLWELAVARKNAGALLFWRGVANDLASGPLEELDEVDGWDGAILRFRVSCAVWP